MTFVLVPQPTFGQQAQTKLLGLREINFWAGGVIHEAPGPSSSKASLLLQGAHTPRRFLTAVFCYRTSRTLFNNGKAGSVPDLSWCVVAFFFDNWIRPLLKKLKRGRRTSRARRTYHWLNRTTRQANHVPPLSEGGLLTFDFCLGTSTRFWTTSTDEVAWPQGDHFLSGGLYHRDVFPATQWQMHCGEVQLQPQSGSSLLRSFRAATAGKPRAPPLASGGFGWALRRPKSSRPRLRAPADLFRPFSETEEEAL